MKAFLLLSLSIFTLADLYSRTVEAGGNNSIVDPFSVTFDQEGNMYGVEYVRSNRVFRVGVYGETSIVAGIQAKTSQKMGDQGASDGSDPLKAHFNGMHDLAMVPGGLIYLADTFNARVRRFDPVQGTLETVLGTGQPGFSGDGGPAHLAQVAQVHCLSFNPDYSKLYFTDLPNRRIRVMDTASGMVSTVAGTGEKAVPEDGANALKAPLFDPRAVLVDRDENIYICSRAGHALRVVGRNGNIRTVINASGEKGYSGDGGPALQAKMNGPKHLAMDPQGRILITDTENHCIRRYDPATGLMELIAGVPGVRGRASSEDPLKIELARPHGSRVRDGWLFIADSENDRVIWFPY